MNWPISTELNSWSEIQQNSCRSTRWLSMQTETEAWEVFYQAWRNMNWRTKTSQKQPLAPRPDVTSNTCSPVKHRRNAVDVCWCSYIRPIFHYWCCDDILQIATGTRRMPCARLPTPECWFWFHFWRLDELELDESQTVVRKFLMHPRARLSLVEFCVLISVIAAWSLELLATLLTASDSIERLVWAYSKWAIESSHYLYSAGILPS